MLVWEIANVFEPRAANFEKIAITSKRLWILTANFMKTAFYKNKYKGVDY